MNKQVIQADGKREENGKEKNKKKERKKTIWKNIDLLLHDSNYIY